jgi:hypothetical protein
MAGFKECAARALSGLIGAVIGTVATLGLLGTGVVAVVSAHGGNSSLIHACVKPNGQITIVGASDSCGKDSPLDWAIQGPPGISGLVQRTETGNGGAFFAAATAECLDGELALGGGYQIGPVSALTDEFFTEQNRPNIDGGTQPNGWYASVARTSGVGAWHITTFVICATVAD